MGNGAFGKFKVFTKINKYAGYVFEAIDDNRKQRVAIKRTQKAGNVVSREFEILSMLKGSSNVI